MTTNRWRTAVVVLAVAVVFLGMMVIDLSSDVSDLRNKRTEGSRRTTSPSVVTYGDDDEAWKDCVEAALANTISDIQELARDGSIWRPRVSRGPCV